MQKTESNSRFCVRFKKIDTLICFSMSIKGTVEGQMCINLFNVNPLSIIGFLFTFYINTTCLKNLKKITQERWRPFLFGI